MRLRDCPAAPQSLYRLAPEPLGGTGVGSLMLDVVSRFGRSLVRQYGYVLRRDAPLADALGASLGLFQCPQADLERSRAGRRGRLGRAEHGPPQRLAEGRCPRLQNGRRKLLLHRAEELAVGRAQRRLQLKAVRLQVQVAPRAQAQHEPCVPPDPEGFREERRPDP